MYGLSLSYLFSVNETYLDLHVEIAEVSPTDMVWELAYRSINAGSKTYRIIKIRKNCVVFCGVVRIAFVAQHQDKTI